MTPTSWSYTQKLDLSELRYMIQILRSDNDVMQARSIRRMIELICRGIRQGFYDEIIGVIQEEQLMKMLRIRTHFSRKEVQMIRDVLMHIIEAFQPFVQEIEDNQQQQASQKNQNKIKLSMKKKLKHNLKLKLLFFVKPLQRVKDTFTTRIFVMISHFTSNNAKTCPQDYPEELEGIKATVVLEVVFLSIQPTLRKIISC
ncbi:MAG: hypothetical protein EZS28_037602 [Streblomastix strix]|uniref:Uncharacterized protein n=1 Tax=Streblomastix strix TaxID=222440 RepID=A0A5J4U9I7_9EUKA|nr:MAG: hypothetical protein EZS28_037602 [Streblomastix strix]